MTVAAIHAATTSACDILLKTQAHALDWRKGPYDIEMKARGLPPREREYKS